MNSFFSIIIPVYKIEEYLNRCIESILKQSCRSFEIILVDDGSPDSCPYLCDEWKQNNSLISVIHKENGGLSSARNAGIDAASGDYLLFVDGDDYWCDSRVLERLRARIENHKEDVVLLGCKNIYGSGREEVTRGGYDFSLLSLHDKQKTLSYLISSHRWPGSAWIMCVKRDLVQTQKIRFREGVTAEDYEWIVSILVNCSKIGAIDGIHYAYVKRIGSITSHPSFSAVEGSIYAIQKYYSYDIHEQAIAKFLSQVYLLTVKIYRSLSSEDKYKAKPLLTQYSTILIDANNKMFYYFIKVVGLNLSSRVINFIYNIIR